MESTVFYPGCILCGKSLDLRSLCASENLNNVFRLGIRKTRTLRIILELPLYTTALVVFKLP